MPLELESGLFGSVHKYQSDKGSGRGGADFFAHAGRWLWELCGAQKEETLR